MLELKSQLFKIDKNIGFAHFIPDTPVFDDTHMIPTLRRGGGGWWWVRQK